MKPFIERDDIFFAAKKEQLFEQIAHRFHENGREVRMALGSARKFVAQVQHDAPPTKHRLTFFAFVTNCQNGFFFAFKSFLRHFVFASRKRFHRNHGKNFKRRCVFGIKKPTEHNNTIRVKGLERI